MSRYESWDEEEDRVPRPPSPFHFSDLLLKIRNRRKFILLSSVIFTLVVFLLSFFIKDTYESTAVILPPRQDQSVSALLSGVGGNLSSLAAGGGLSAMSLKNPNEIYTSLLASRTLNTNIVNQFNLKAYYHQSTVQNTIKTLQKHTSIELGKDNLIRISVRSHNANFSSQLANAFVDQLHDMNTNLALTESAQRRLFYQQQLDQEKVSLAKAETDLEETQTATGIIQPSGQADMVSRSISSLRAQITDREAELQSLKTFDAPGNPEYMQLEAEVGSLQRQLSKLENNAKAQTPGDIEVPTAQLPKSALEYARKYREVQQHEQVYALLLKQFEAAKIDESKTAPVIEVVDRAVPAELKSNPSRLLICLGALIFALLLNLSWSATVYTVEVLRLPLASVKG
jgi:tyrosine-protein kinase Etk/Wzc